MAPVRKSCTAPAKMQPKTTQSRAAGPYTAPRMGPNTGPRPAMFSNWMKKILYGGRATQSTPSALLCTGVGRVRSTPKTFSTKTPYTA